MDPRILYSPNFGNPLLFRGHLREFGELRFGVEKKPNTMRALKTRVDRRFREDRSNAV